MSHSSSRTLETPGESGEISTLDQLCGVWCVCVYLSVYLSVCVYAHVMFLQHLTGADVVTSLITMIKVCSLEFWTSDRGLLAI